MTRSVELRVHQNGSTRPFRTFVNGNTEAEAKYNARQEVKRYCPQATSVEVLHVSGDISSLHYS